MTAGKAANIIRILSDKQNRDPRFLASVVAKIVRQVRTAREVAKMTDEELLEEASPTPWYFDGWDIFTTGPTDNTGGHRLVVPLPHDTFHFSQRVSHEDAELIVRAVNYFNDQKNPGGKNGRT